MVVKDLDGQIDNSYGLLFHKDVANHLYKKAVTIDQIELLIEYLEKIEKLTGTLTWDCKNLIDLQRLETT
jgi:hypothetical protein